MRASSAEQNVSLWMPGRRIVAWLTSWLPGVGKDRLTEDQAARLRAEQIVAISRLTPAMMAANLFAAAVVFVVSRDHPNHAWVIVWTGAMTLVCGLALRQWWLSMRRGYKPRASHRAVQRVVVGCVIPATLWGLAAIMVYPRGNETEKLLMSSITLGSMCVGALGLSTVLRASLAYTGTISLFSIVAVAIGWDTGYAAMIALLAIYTIIVWGAAVWYGGLFTESVHRSMQVEEQSDLVSLLLRDFQENASDWLFTVDEHCRLTMVSPTFLDRLGMVEDDVLGRNLITLLRSCAILEPTPETPVAHVIAADLFAKRESAAGVEVACQIGSERRWWSVSIKPVWSNTEVFGGFRGVCSDITESKRDEARLEQLAHHDSLTGLPNRTAFQVAIEQAVTHASGVHLLLLDLDNFKMVNDTLGHLAGDTLLFEVSDRLREATSRAFLVARLGGDEFAILLPGALDDEAVLRIADSIVASVSAPVMIDGARAHVGGSIGIASAPRDGSAATDLIRRADLALYEAKSAGRGRSIRFHSAIEAEAAERRMLEDDLRQALPGGQLRLVFQPIVSIREGRIVGAEALLRWTHPERGEISPARFIPIAEECGLIVDMGEWVIAEACRRAARWPRHLQVSVNVSAAQLEGNRLPTAIVRALAETGLLPQQLSIEVTESVLVDQSAAKTLFSTLRALGIAIALDDFGTGYASLSYLRMFQFDKLKIDQSFVREAKTRPDCAAIVRATAGLARELGMTTVAEGVETAAELAVVGGAGCDLAQGYHFARPMETDAFLALIVEQDVRPGRRRAS
jgi:diguanylate cyclase (GGDEF)-like protein/PAS domain S-box-containing protein